MAANQTSVHKKMDKILQKLATLEDNDKALLKQTNYLAQLVVLARQDSARQQQESQAMLRESQAMLRDMGQMLLEIKQSSDRTEERVAAILAETR
jgi:hypothetical protein